MTRLGAIGAALCLVMALLAIGSHCQDAEAPFHPALWTTALLMTAGLIWLLLLPVLPTIENVPQAFAVILFVGVILRGLLLPSLPILEIDYFRYLWDGIVVSRGLNPYAVSPEAALSGANAPTAWSILARDHATIVENINYAPLRTIYPPVAQFFFWLTAIIPAKADLLVLRTLLIGCEVVTLMFLISLLKQAGQSSLWVALYWWNPLIIKELVNSAHMDAILLPFLVGAVWLAVRNRLTLSALSLTLAIGVKIWPILLAPLLLFKLPFKKFVAVGFLMTLLLGLMAWPIVAGRLDGSSGFVAYAALWARNEALFSLVENGLALFVDAMGLHLLDPGRLARLVIALSVGLLALYLGVRSWQTPNELVYAVAILAAVLFLSSATGYPWYYAWLLPFLVVIRLRSLLLLTVVLPLYYLRFYFVEIGEVALFDTYIVWLEFGPVLALFTWEVLRQSWKKERHR